MCWLILILSLSQPPIINDAAPLTIAASIDYFSTKYALDSPNTREWNPGQQNESIRIFTKSVVALGSTWIVRKIRDKNELAARITKYSLIAIQTVAGIWNVQLAIKQRRKFDATAR